MHAHILASPSSAEEPRKPPDRVECIPRRKRPKFEFWPMMWLGEIDFSAVTWPRLFHWGNDACWPIVDRSQFLTRVGSRNEFFALLFVPRILLPESVETKVKRNISMWCVRRVSFWNDCDELIQEWLNIVQELADAEDLLL